MMKVNISQIIDRMGVTKFTWLIFILCGVGIMFDGYDNMIVAYTMPQIAKEWGLSKVQTGSLVSWGMLGLMFGGLIAGIISDRIGRKKAMILSCIVYSLFCGLVYWAPDFKTFAILRVLSGIGLGAALPVGMTLVTEYVPSKNRGFFVGSLFAFFTLGWVIAGAVAIYVVPTWGWRPTFFLGLLPIFFAFYLVKALPESPRWLLSKGREADAIKIIQDVEKYASGTANEYAPGSLAVPPAPPHVGVGALFSKNFIAITLSFWVIYLFGTMIIYGVSGWLPTLLVGKGYSVVKSYSFMMLSNTAACIGGLVTGFVSDKIGRKKNLLISYICFGIVLALLGFASNQWQVFTFVILAGFFTNFCLTGLQPVMAETYPTEFRNTGVSWAQGIGRLGGISGPILAGVVLQMGGGFTETLLAFSAVAILIAIIISFFKLEGKGKTLEKITSEMSVEA